MQKVRFKGGPIFLNSGGMGPDDYLIKPVKGGRWTRVIMRWGRHFRNDPVLGDYEPRQENVESDKVAWAEIAKFMRQLSVSEGAQRWSRDKGHIPTMSATDFLEKYEGARVFVVDHYGRVRREVL